MQKLTGPQYRRLCGILLSAFPSKSDLAELVRFRLDERLDAIAGGDDTKAVVFNLIDWAEANGRLEDLLKGAAAERPKSAELADFARAVGVPLAAAPALNTVPAPPRDFVGRAAEIELLVGALAPADGSGGVAAIRGLGGSGKSALAYAVGARLRDAFPDGRLYLELRGSSDNPMLPTGALQTVLRAFSADPQEQLPPDLAGLQALYCSRLEGKRALILADDSRDAAQVEALLPPPGSALLITSRARFYLEGMVPLDLDALPPKDAETLLLRLCPRLGKAAPSLAELCGRLPLALRTSAGALANSTRPVAAYLAELADLGTRLAHLGPVEAVLRLSADALDPPAQAVLYQLSVFPTGFDLPAAEAVLDLPAAGPGPQDALDLLYQRSLLEWNATTERYSLYDLVRAFAAARLANPDAAHLRHAQHYAAVAARSQELYLQAGAGFGAGLALFDLERANIDAGWAWVLAQSGEEADNLLLRYADSTVQIGDLRYDNRRKRIPQFEAALEAARRLKRKDDEANALSNLGSSYLGLGEARRSIEYHEQNLKIAREAKNRYGEGIALGNLGVAYADLGDTRRAIGYYEQALAIARALKDRWQEGSVLGNLGNTYSDLGDYSRAVEYYEQQRDIARGFGDQRGEGMVLNNLGEAYVNLGDAGRAVECYEQARDISRIVGDRRVEGAALNNLGEAYAAGGDFPRAIEHYEQSLSILHDIGFRPGEGELLNNLGQAHAALGNPQRALSDYEQSLSILRSVGDRQEEADASWHFGLLLEQQGDLARAAELMQVRVDYEREIGHAAAEQHAAQLEQLRTRLPKGA
ncbi:MAG: ATP-binding protein [Chloroflexia bacterium]